MVAGSTPAHSERADGALDAAAAPVPAEPAPSAVADADGSHTIVVDLDDPMWGVLRGPAADLTIELPRVRGPQV
jgi:hypothetical protein